MARMGQLISILPTAMYKQSLEEIATLLNPNTGMRHVARTLVWTHDKKRAKDALNTLERLKTLISIGLQEDNL